MKNRGLLPVNVVKTRKDKAVFGLLVRDYEVLMVDRDLSPIGAIAKCLQVNNHTVLLNADNDDAKRAVCGLYQTPFGIDVGPGADLQGMAALFLLAQSKRAFRSLAAVTISAERDRQVLMSFCFKNEVDATSFGMARAQAPSDIKTTNQIVNIISHVNDYG